MGVFVCLYIYILIIGAISYFAHFNTQKRRLFQTIACALGLWIVLALRSPYCGYDLVRENGAVCYYSVFQDVKNYTVLDCLDVRLMLGTGMDIGWFIYNKILSLFTDSFQMLLAITSFIELFLISKVIYKFSSHVIFSFIIFFTMGIYLASFSTLRQTLALAITSYSFVCLFEKKYLKYTLLVILASLIHFSSFLFFIIYPLSKISINKINGLWALLFIFISIPFLGIILQVIAQSILGDLRSVESDKGGAYTLFVLYVFIYLLTLFSVKTTIYGNYLKLFMLLAVAGQSLGAISTGHLTRIAFFFSVFFILSLPQILDSRIEEKYRKLSILAISVLLFSFFVYVSKDGYLDVVPYSFFWESNSLI